jgi:hypothetical protein
MIFFINVVAMSGYYDTGVVILKGKNKRSVFRIREWGFKNSHSQFSFLRSPSLYPFLGTLLFGQPNESPATSYLRRYLPRKPLPENDLMG